MSLEKALLVDTTSDRQIEVMFNPEEYTLERRNTYSEIGIPGLETPPIQYVRGNLQTLTMDLFFDTYEARTDVRDHTRRITTLMDKNPSTKAPPVLLFIWGDVHLPCVLDSATQKFTMFLSDGTPVRATLSVTFKEYEAVQIDIQRGFFVGPPSIRNLAEGESLSDLAATHLGDPAAWREIARVNDVEDPRRIPPGTRLVMPDRKASGEAQER